MTTIKAIRKQIENLVLECIEQKMLNKGDLFVIGCSTSEISGKQIGTSSNEEIASELFHGLKKLQEKTNIHLAFQCCEHLNRSLVVEKETMEKYHLDEVTVIPTPTAGGAMATRAYQEMTAPIVVETIQAHAGIDIGETMIGMHLRPVVVPLRFKQKHIGHARITAARTRPKLIGGSRAHYR